MRPRGHIISALGLLTALAVGAWADRAVSMTGSARVTPVLVAVQAAHHRGFDRIVFTFSGTVPSGRRVSYASRLVADPSGRNVSIAGRAILRVSFSPATAHNASGRSTTPGRTAFALPNIMAVVRAGDFESVVSYGIGLAKRTPVHVFTLTRPSRIVIDTETPFRTTLKGAYFFNQRRFEANRPPFVTRVLRPVQPGTPATGLMDRLFAGPTASEHAAGLRLLQSKATGFTNLSVRGGVARITLTGGCGSGGSTVSISDEIVPSLKQLPGVKHVKIFDPAGHTETPTGRNDSRPFCLEP